MRTLEEIHRESEKRSRRADRTIFWSALAAAFAAHVLFWAVFSYRPVYSGSRGSSSSVTMLSREELAEINDWLRYHDPAAFNRGDYRKAVSPQSFREVGPGFEVRRPEVGMPVRTYTLNQYRELPTPPPPMRAVLPVPLPEPPPAPEPKARPGRITDGRGNELRVDGVELLPRTPRAIGDTVLRVLNPGRYPTLSLERSCGDAELDRFAQRVLLPLANSDRAPEYLIVSWPDPKKEVRK